MKTAYKNLLMAASGAVMCLFLAVPAIAQHTTTGGGGGGGGGGGSKSSGGGGGGSVSSSRPSGGGSSASASRPSGGYGVSRPSAGMGQRSSPSGQHNVGYANRPGVARGSYTYVNRQGVVVKANNYGAPQRFGVGPARGAAFGVNGYRTAPRIGYGRGGYWANRGYYHYNHGYYKSYYSPRLGFRCRILPYGYYPFFWGDYQYYLCDGLFYTYDNDEYTVVEPPIGAEVTTLPEKAQSIVINGQQYYECDGVYYEPITKDDGTVVYMVAGKDGELNTGANVQDDQPQGPQLGDIVSQLPQDCRKIKVNGEKLWISPDGVYYQELLAADGTKTYKIVGLPDDTDPN